MLGRLVILSHINSVSAAIASAQRQQRASFSSASIPPNKYGVNPDLGVDGRGLNPPPVGLDSVSSA